MNVFRTLKQILSDCTLLDDFNNGVHVDYTESSTGTCGLFPTGTKKTGEDVLGNLRYRLSCTLYASMATYEDYERLNNSDFLLSLSYYLDTLKDIDITEEINGVSRSGEITKVSASGGMLYVVNNEDINDGGQYQLQINVDYMINE